ncbi:MAG: T9SS type A sorting domain-containing protein [Bacteroidota bacterium]
MKTNLTLILFLLVTSLGFAQNDICGIDLRSGTPFGAYATGEKVYIDFEYSIDEPSGARIFVRPMTNGSLTPGYGASGSPLYTGAGTSESNFTINRAGPTVDELRFIITNADQTEQLREFYVPVHYEFFENGVHDFTFSADQGMASFLLGEKVNISFDYDIRHPGGTRIFIRPMTNGSLTPGYGASGSILFTGTGSRTANFSINSGVNVRVDSLRVLITNADQSERLQEFFIPVNWYWSTVKISNIDMLGSPFAANGENRTVRFDYETTETAGVRIFPRPFTNNGLTPGYRACGSSILMGADDRDCSFTISENNLRVDHVRFSVVNPDQSATLLEMYYPTDLYFGDLQVKNLVMCPPSPARLPNSERINMYYDLDNGTSAPVRLFMRPVTEGNLTSGYGASGSPSYPRGESFADDFFTINAGDQHIDQARFRVTTDNQSATLADFLINVDYTYGAPMLTSAASPEAVEQLSWKVFPNPLTDYAQLTLTPAASHTVNICLVDLLGRQLKTWPNQRLSAGVEHRLNLDRHAMQLPAGTYFLHLQGKEYMVTETVVVQ